MTAALHTHGVTPIPLYKIFVDFKAFVHESIIPFLPLLIFIAHTIAIIAILLHDVCAIYDAPPTTFCMPYTPHTIGIGNNL